MGNREQLLAGAKQCLLERGYTQTTARDIVAASGTNLASIGYHFGSKDALMTAAMVEAMSDWGEEVGRALGGIEGATPAERFATMWAGLIASVGTHRSLWAASFEAGPVADRVPEIRAMLGAAQQEGRTGLAALILGVEEHELDERTVRTVGSLLIALVPGVTAQWLIDPDRAPTATELVEGLRTLLAGIQKAEPSAG